MPSTSTLSTNLRETLNRIGEGLYWSDEDYLEVVETIHRRAEADEYYFVMDEPITPDDYPSIFQLSKPYCVYILKCERKGFDELSSFTHIKQVLQNRAEQLGYDYTEDWIEAVYHSAPPHYVGLTTNPYTRIYEHTQIRQHVNNPGGFDPRGARFTAIFRPYSVQNIKWVEDEQTALQLEQAEGNRLNNEENYFVYP